MKIKSLLLLGLATICSMNAFAAWDTQDFRVNGVVYNTEDVLRQAKVAGLTEGATATSIEIPATITISGNTFTVIGFETTWQNANPSLGPGTYPTEALGTAFAKLTFDATNFTSSPTLPGTVKELVIKGTASSDFTIPDGAGLEKLNVSELAAASGKKITFGLPNQHTTIKEVALNPNATYAANIDLWKSPNLEKVTGIKVVGLGCLADCPKLKEVSLATGATVADNAFKGDGALATINMGVATEIGANAFDISGVAGAKSVAIDLSAAKKIGANAFNGNAATSLTIPAQVEEIASGAFAGMAKLATVNINIDNAKLKAIGHTTGGATPTYTSWFGGATIKTVNINTPQVTEIYPNAFAGQPIDDGKLSITAPKLAKIGANAFGAAKLTKVNFNTLTELATVDDAAFQANTYTEIQLGLTKLTAIPACFITNSKDDLVKLGLPANMTNLAGLNALTKLKALDLPKNLTTIAASALQNCAALESIVIPAKVTTIGDAAFAGCAKLATVDLSGAAALTSIGQWAFEDCAVLESIAIPAKVATIDLKAFNGCSKLANVDFSNAAELATIGNNAFDGTKLTTIDLSNCAKLATISATSFPKNLYTSVKLGGTKLNDASFAIILANWFTGVDPLNPANTCKTTLAEVTLPSAITNIPANAFKGFKALKEISLPKAVTVINANAFEASGLTAFKVRENVTTIGDYAFENCADLAIVNFSEATALTAIGVSAFENSGVKEVAIPANANGLPLAIASAAFKKCAKLKSFSAKSWTGAVDNWTFENCAKLSGIVIPAAITSIGMGAFYNCSSLAKVTFKYAASDAGLTGGIGDAAFAGCEALASLDLSATKLANLNNSSIFRGCTSLAEITFPATGFTSLNSDGLFADCPIENFDITGTQINTIGNIFGMYYSAGAAPTNTLADFTVRVANRANKTLKSIKIGAANIPANAFAFCTALESAEIGQATIGFLAFDHCSSLASVVLEAKKAPASPAPNDVAANAFNYCTALKTFTYEPEAAISVKPVNDNAFTGCIPFVKFVTNNFYWDANPTAPMNTTYGVDAAITSVKTVQDKANANQFFAKYYNTALDAEFDANDCKLFTVYVDGETAYFQACRTFEGKYYIPFGVEVIVKTSEAKEVNFKPVPAAATFPVYVPGFPAAVPATGSIGWDDMYCSQPGDDLARVQFMTGVAAGKYLYRLTNTADQGFGFTFFSGTTIKEGQFFIACSKKPAGAGRLNEVWLDENGNVIEGDATGIETINEAAELNGEVYNLQGVRVENPVKGGIYIKNGKKFVVK